MEQGGRIMIEPISGPVGPNGHLTEELEESSAPIVETVEEESK